VTHWGDGLGEQAMLEHADDTVLEVSHRLTRRHVLFEQREHLPAFVPDALVHLR
jgi:hypothetical protein